jgi:ribosomal protein S18 acetylase RimI-like enzyme
MRRAFAPLATQHLFRSSRALSLSITSAPFFLRRKPIGRAAWAPLLARYVLPFVRVEDRVLSECSAGSPRFVILDTGDPRRRGVEKAMVLLRSGVRWKPPRTQQPLLAARAQRPNSAPMLIRPARPEDRAAIWTIIGPVIRAGQTYALDRDMSEADALAYWLGPDKETFVAEEDGAILATYYMRPNQAGGGRHVCNCGYVTGAWASGRGVARRMGEHSLEHARERGYKAMQFNFVVGSNERAVRLWQSLGFEIAGRLPLAFEHPSLGPVDALVMFRPL